MKKNYLFSSLAMAAMLFTTACQEQDLVDASMADTDVVTFTVNTQQVATRSEATGEGSLADKLYYGVYEYVNDQWKLIETISKTQTAHESFTAENGGLVELRLAKQKKYSIIFWAEAENGSLCDVDWEARTLKVNNSIDANAESYDAFWGYDEITINGAQKKEVDLVRPFAQLNIGVSDEDYQAAIDASVELQKSAITVKNVPTTMSLEDGTVVAYDESSSVTYTTAAIPSSDAWTFPVAGHKYLALNYVLVGTEQSLIDVELSYTDTENGSYSSTFTSVPVRRNYRTNIYGNLLTSDADYSVKIEAGIDGTINPEDQLKDVLTNGGKFTLLSDMTLPEEFTIPEGKNVEIDLNDNTLTVATETSVKGNLKILNGNIDIDVEGEGGLLPAFNTKDGATVDFEDANVEVADGSLAVLVQGVGSTVNVTDTKITGDGIYSFYNGNLTLNVNNSELKDDYAVYIMSAKALVTIDEKSSIKDFWAGSSSKVDVVYTGNKPTIKDDGTANEVNFYTESQFALKEALENGGTMTLTSDFTIDEAITVEVDKDVTIDLAGNTLTISSVNNLEGNLTLKNGTVSVNIPREDNGMYAAFTPKGDGHVKIEDATVTVAKGNSLVAVYKGDRDAMNTVIDVTNSTITVEQGGNGILVPFDVNYVEANLVNSTISGPNGFIVLETITNALITLDANSSIENISVCSGNVSIVYEGTKPAVSGSGNITYYTDKRVYDFNAALELGTASELSLAENVDYGTVTVEELKDVTITGAEGAKMRLVTSATSKIENVTLKDVEFQFTTGTGQKNGAFVVIDKDAEIDNLVIEGCTITGDGKKSSYGIYGQNPNASIVVKNCNFSNLGYAIQATVAGGYESLFVENCTFDNIISWAIMPQYGTYSGNMTITGCTFKNSNGGLIKSGALSDGKTFTFINNTITNCTGHDGEDSKWFEVDASAATKVISGNTKDGADWTPGTAEGLEEYK